MNFMLFGQFLFFYSHYEAVFLKFYLQVSQNHTHYAEYVIIQ